MLRASRPLIHLHRAVYPEIQSSNIVLLCALLAVEPPPLSLLVRVAGWGRRPSRERCARSETPRGPMAPGLSLAGHLVLLRQATEPVGALDTNVKLARVVEAGPRVIAAAAADAVHGQLGWAKENLPHRRKPAVPPRVECRGLGRQGSGNEQASEDQAQTRSWRPLGAKAWVHAGSALWSAYRVEGSAETGSAAERSAGQAAR